MRVSGRKLRFSCAVSEPLVVSVYGGCYTNFQLNLCQTIMLIGLICAYDNKEFISDSQVNKIKGQETFISSNICL